MKPAYQTPKPTAPTTPHSKIASIQKKAFKNAQRRASESSGIHSAGNQHGPMPVLELYQKENCPFSHAVRNKLTRLGLDFVAHSIPDGHPLKHEQLIRAGGLDQLPFLIDHTSGVKLYESPVILAYLDKTYGEPGSKDWLGSLADAVSDKLRSRADQIAWRVAAPLIRAQEVGLSAREAMQSLSKTWDYVLERVQTAMNEAKSKSEAAQT
jgi:glutathione S-transferase